ALPIYFITDTATGLIDGADTEENREVRISVQRKLNLIRASLHLYGIVTFKQLIHLFKKYYDMDITAEEITDFLGGSPYDINIDRDRKSTRLNSSHVSISYAVFCLKKKKTKKQSYSNKFE